MKRKIFLSLLSVALLFFSSCHFFEKDHDDDKEKTRDLTQVKIGMGFADVLQLAGVPDQKADLGSVTDSFGNQIHSEEWYYGNQLIRFDGDTVSSIVTDVNALDKKIQHIIDSARAAGDTGVMIHAE